MNTVRGYSMRSQLSKYALIVDFATSKNLLFEEMELIVHLAAKFAEDGTFRLLVSRSRTNNLVRFRVEYHITGALS